MSGIAGIICFDGAPIEPSQITKITGAMAYRGPDGIHHWVSGPVALGHCMLRTTPESLEETRQSVTLFGRLSPEETVQKWQNRDEFFVDNIPGNGPVHANALNRLGNLYAMQQKSDEAEQVYRQALETYKEYLGPEHDDVGIVRANLNALMTQPR